MAIRELKKGHSYQTSDKRVLRCTRIVPKAGNACLESESGELTIFVERSNLWVNQVYLEYKDRLEYLVWEVADENLP